MTGDSRLRLAGRALACAVLGAVGALGLAPFGYPIATVIALALVPVALGTTWRGAALCGWAFGTGYFALALAWIVEPFLVDVARHGWMAPFALIFMAGGLALFWGAAFWMAARLSDRPVPRVAALIVTWTLAEMARGWVLTGFPWAAPAQIWVGTPADRWLAYIGPEGLTLLTFAAALPLGLTLSAPRWAKGVLPFMLIAVITQLLRFAGPVATTGTGQIVRLVQPNAPQHQKWDPAFMPIFFNRQIDYTSAEPRPDLVVWPEASLPGFIPVVDDPLAAVGQAAGGAQVAVGTVHGNGQEYFNSLLRLDESGQLTEVYDKHHLVPFGEYVPLRRYLPEFGLRALAQVMPGDMAAGPGPQLVDFGDLGRALPLICYEAVFPRDVAAAPERPDFLLQITNDAWFGTWSGPYQHLAQARMRAIEQGIPMVRAANTGVSAMIDPLGRIRASLPLGQAGYVDAELPAPLPPTLYSRMGDVPVLLLLFLALTNFAAARLRRPRAA
ncbi:apolipoprotein N-acyltransferase [Arenibacterium halophilum]|uniref:Apolipoprotein N-acyltransferase n=1 Tax=Arenibacterium halophilum TaxID=2583821 RepID=A0ABY2XEJ4_9RHOB|nr:apolipoprotein N-acyltransferase [Arenibacterium halophilum]TMV15404.1 apolipoprotein N-acyltransferase [Arenibacterium halophilum]